MDYMGLIVLGILIAIAGQVVSALHVSVLSGSLIVGAFAAFWVLIDGLAKPR
jgi:hypothetical protein